MSLITNPRGQFRLYNYDGTSDIVPALQVASDGAWGIRCSNGHVFERRRELVHGFDACASCGGVADGALEILRDDAKLIGSRHALARRVWWHSSPAQEIDRHRPDVMHWGSWEAARDRAHHDYYRRSSANLPHRDYFIHSARLRPLRRVHPHVYLEHHGPGAAHPVDELRQCDVVRYVNSTEAPGSVSLLLRPRNLRCVQRRGVVPPAR